MPKRWQLNDVSTRSLLRLLAENHRSVSITYRARQHLSECCLTVAGLCYLICEYLDNGGVVDETITESAQGHIGEHVFEMHPEIDAHDYYVKVGFDGTPPDQSLRIISFHEEHD